MIVRRALYGWLLPAVLVLPVWLLVGWGLFGGSAWGLVGVLVVLAPAVLVGQLVVALLIRARASVREARAVSWPDAAAVAVWHGLVIALGCFPPGAFAAVLVCACAGYLFLFWSSLARLWGEARAAFAVGFPDAGAGIPPASARPTAHGSHPVIVVHEQGRPEAR